MEDTKKIITRAVYGHKIQTFRNIARIAAGEGETLTDILGCTINGAQVVSSSIEEDFGRGKRVKAVIKFDIHIWYRSENDTRVSKVTAEFPNIIEIVKQGAEFYDHEEVNVWIKQAPNCVDKTVMVQTEGNMAVLQIESMLEAEIIGETTLNIKVFET